MGVKTLEYYLRGVIFCGCVLGGCEGGCVEEGFCLVFVELEEVIAVIGVF